jgi:hypothetical protein
MRSHPIIAMMHPALFVVLILVLTAVARSLEGPSAERSTGNQLIDRLERGNVKFVDPFIGTRKYASWSHAGMIPSVATPFAMVSGLISYIKL